MIPLHESGGNVTFAVKVHPRARKNAITGELGDALKLSLTTPPVTAAPMRPASNFSRNFWKVPRSSVTIASGQTSRNKIICVAGLTVQQLRERLG